MITPWDEARRQRLTRTNPFGETEKIDPGVNFFLLALEKLGAITYWSCEGHPFGFYIVFRCPHHLAVRIHQAGFFTVEIEGHNRWSLRLTSNEHGCGSAWTNRTRNQCLRWAANAWKEKLLV